MKQNPLTPTIPLDRDGSHHGFLKLPHSRNDSAWGAILIPFSVIQNGSGPTALLTGANHGDEYEGPVALQNLALTLKPTDIRGRVIIVPAFNYPAFRSGSRNSPIDDKNLNRVFPGDPNGSVTEKIADYFMRTLVPHADVIVDIHSGGKTLEFVPMAAAHVLDDKTQQSACVAAMQAFNAPYSALLVEIDNTGMYDTAAEDCGKTFVSTELGGGGTTRSTTVRLAKKGVRNILIHAGILNAKPMIEPTVNVEMPDADCFIISEHDGLLEPLIDLGDTVAKDVAIAQIWPLDRTGVKPVVLHSQRAGVLAGRHFPGLVKCGDCIAVLASVV